MSRKFQCAFVGMILLSLVLPTTSAKAAVINVGVLELLPNQANQWRDVYISGSESVGELEFFAQVGQGLSGPKISNVDLISGIFSVNNVGQSLIDLSLSGGMLADYVVGFSTKRNDFGNDVIANGILAKIEFNTIGMFASPETWSFSLTGVAAAGGKGRDTMLTVSGSFEPIYLEITNGSLRVIPEPSSLLLALSGLGLAGAVYASRRRASRARG